MESRRTLRFEVPDRDTLETLVAGRLPGDFEERSSDVDFFRDVYFDTPGGDLKEKGAAVHLRLYKNGTARLLLDVLEQRPGSGPPRRRTAEGEVADAEGAQLFRGDSEPAKQLRALIDPDLLQKVLEVETFRRQRKAGDGADQITFCYDVVTLRRGELATDFYELEMSASKQAFPTAVLGLQELQQDYALRPTLAETQGRARELLEDLEINALQREIRSAREVVVVIYRAGSIGLQRGESGLIVPHGSGSGAQACRQALRNALGHGRARIRLLGTSTGSAGRAALEVWLAEDVADTNGAIQWLPLRHALERAGAPGLRDGRTLAALNVIARSGFGSWAATAPTAQDVASEDGQPTEPLELVLQRLEAADGTQEATPKEVPPALLLNMDISRIGFDERILVFAEDPHTPLLERVRFLGMFGERRDDFFTTRVARFKRMLAEGSEERSIDGLTPGEQLDAIAVRARQIMRRAYQLLNQQLIPQLEQHGISIGRWSETTDEDRAYVRETYGQQLAALITPLASDPTHPFPHLRNLRPALAAIVRLPEGGPEQFVAVELPGDLPRFVPLPGEHRFVPLEDVIAASLPELYRGLSVLRAHTFRITRSAHLDIDSDPLDMMQAVEEKITMRPFQEVVRLEVERGTPPDMRHRLLRELQFDVEGTPSTLGEQDVYTVDRLVDLASLAEIAAIDRPEFKFPPSTPRDPLEPRSIFEQIRERERFVHFPYDSFEQSVERLLQEAADDPDVLAVKVTVYRTSKDSGVVDALRRARENGKDALAMVELKASFDEQRNIEWARDLEAAGIRVVLSPPKYKVHAKIALVLRREGEELRRYCYIGTGNLNARTAASYVDIGILTADPLLTEEVNSVFNLLTGYSSGGEMNMLLVAPFNMRRRFVRLIEREAEHARAGGRALIRGQLNGLADRRLIAALYHASQAGVKVELMVREICALRPGVPGVSDNIRITTQVGRYLQHARIFHFHNAGEDEYYIGSADWRPRNMIERVEVATPVRDPEHQQRLSEILEHTLAHPDRWELRPDGTYVRGSEVIGALEPAAETAA